MSKSRNDLRRNSFKSYDDEANGSLKAIKEKTNHRQEKRINAALKKMAIDELYDDEEY